MPPERSAHGPPGRALLGDRGAGAGALGAPGAAGLPAPRVGWGGSLSHREPEPINFLVGSDCKALFLETTGACKRMVWIVEGRV